MASLQLLQNSQPVWGIEHENQQNGETMLSLIGYLLRTWLTVIIIMLYAMCFASVGIGFVVLYKDFIIYLKSGLFVFTTFSKYTDGVFDGHINATGEALDSINSILIQIGDTPAAMVLIAIGIVCLVLLLLLSFISPREVPTK